MSFNFPLKENQKDEDDMDGNFGVDGQEDLDYANWMLAELNKQAFYHKYWGRRQTQAFKHSKK